MCPAEVSGGGAIRVAVLTATLLASCSSHSPPSTADLRAGCGRGLRAPVHREVRPGLDTAPAVAVARRFVEAYGNVASDNLDTTAAALLEVTTGHTRENFTRTSLADYIKRHGEIRTDIRESEVFAAEEHSVHVKFIAARRERARPGPGGHYYLASQWTVDLKQIGASWKVDGYGEESVGPC